MKKFLYILYIGILLTGCAQNTSKSLQKEADYHPARSVQPEEKSEEKVVKKYDKKLQRKKKIQTKKELINSKLNATDKEEDVDYDHHFNEIAKQKLQQLFDISLLLDAPSTKQDMKDYAQKHAKRLFIPSKKINITAEIKKLHFAHADSIHIAKMKLINLTEIDEYRQVSEYQLQIVPYKNGIKQKAIRKKAKLYFEIIDLDINGVIRQTIKGKIMKIE